MAEYWDLYDADRRDLHQTMKRGDAVPSGAHHIVADIWTITPDGRFLLTQRAQGKTYAGMWECTGGSVQAGETSEEGARRELFEEVGLNVAAGQLKLLHSVRVFERFVDTYLCRSEINLSRLVLQDLEVSAAKLVTYDELCALFAKGEVMPRERFPLYQEQLKNESLKILAERKNP